MLPHHTPAAIGLSVPSPAYSLEVELAWGTGSRPVDALISRLAATGTVVELVDRGPPERDRRLRVRAGGEAQLAHALSAVRDAPGLTVSSVRDPTVELHRNGKLRVEAAPIRDRDDLAMAYTPGVARISSQIAATPDAVWDLTTRKNSVAVVTDGTAVLGLGDVGPLAALPVMEGKAALFKTLAGVDAWPICLDVTDPTAIVETVLAIAPGFGGINLEDISAPRCFDIERQLDEAVDIPVFHDDQHGTAIVVTAALANALRVVGKSLSDVKIVVSGIGAAGTAVTDALLAEGATQVIGCDRGGALHPGRKDLHPHKASYAERTNPERLGGSVDDVVRGADVFIGLSAPGAVSDHAIASMAESSIVFALANPIPEISPLQASATAAVVATGRSDYPNQINNVLAFPGVFRGALDARATRITSAMRSEAARALAACVGPAELSERKIVPDVFEPGIAATVAAAVAAAKAH